jgi:S1-C subfamily serine protease
VKKSIVAAAILGIVSVCAFTGVNAVTSELSAEAAFREAREYTVRIRTRVETPFYEDERGSWSGAGFLVDAKRGWIVTNAHVSARSPSEVEVAFANGEYERVRTLYADSFADIAILEMSHPVEGHRVAPLGRTDLPSIGDPVVAFGHPLGIPFTGTRGIVSGHTDQAGYDLIQVDATVDHGNSGGPVISLRDRVVVGIATAGVGGDKSDRMNFATPIEDVHRILALLRAGVSPCPPRLGFSLLKDEDDRYTLRVASSFDSTRWPLRPGDRIVAVEGRDEPLERLHDLVGALRGRSGQVRLTVERDSQEIAVKVRPTMQAPMLGRRGLSIDGALIAPIDFEDLTNTPLAARLMIHDIEPATSAHTLSLRAMDTIHSIDGRRFDDLETLAAYMHRRPKGPVAIIVRRFSGDMYRMFEYHRRELPGEDIHAVGGETEAIAAQP